MSWRLALSLDVLRREFNTLFPDRDRASDGGIGDASHANSRSDHNPNSAGVVCAYDVDTDLDGTDDSNDPQMDAIVEYIRLHPHPDLKYVIYQRRIASRKYGFVWRAYTGDSHTTHPHFSVGVGPDGQSTPGTYDDTTPWNIAAALGGQPAQPQPSEEEMVKAHFGVQQSLPANKREICLIQPYYASRRPLNGPEYDAYKWLDSFSGNRLLEDQAIHEYDDNFWSRIPILM